MGVHLIVQLLQAIQLSELISILIIFKMKNKVIPIFPIPVVVTNIGRDFTEDELQLFFEDILMMKRRGRGQGGSSEDLYLFDH